MLLCRFLFVGFVAKVLARLLISVFDVFWVDSRLDFWLGFDWLLVGFEFL